MSFNNDNLNNNDNENKKPEETNNMNNQPEDFMDLGDCAAKKGKFEQACYAYALAAAMFKDQRDDERQQRKLESTPLGKKLNGELWITIPKHVAPNQQISWEEWIAVNERMGKLYLTDGGRKAFGSRYRQIARNAGYKVIEYKMGKRKGSKTDLRITPDQAAAFQATLEDMEDNTETEMIVTSR